MSELNIVENEVSRYEKETFEAEKEKNDLMLEETEDDQLIAELERKVAELQDTVNN